MTNLPTPPAPDIPVVPAAELEARAQRIATRLRAHDLNGAFLLHPSSGFYLTGTMSQGWPFVNADGRAVLPLRTSLGRAANECSWPAAKVRRPADLPASLQELGLAAEGRIGVELDILPVLELRRLERAFPGVEFVDVSRIIREVRAVKSPYEIDWIERAARIVCSAMDDALPAELRAGQREIDIMAFLEGEMRRNEHQGTIRVRRWTLDMHFGCVSSGWSASTPCLFDGPDGLDGLYPAVQQGGGRRVIEPNVPIMVDFVGAAGGYIADRTRIFCVGEPPAEAQAAHDFCREILAEITGRLLPGAIPSEIYEDVMKIVAASPFADRFMGWGENQVSFLGHGVGLDLDEFPVLARRFDEPLVEGHVLAVEPKVFLGIQGGVGVENTYVVTTSGARDLTPGPEEIRRVGVAEPRLG